MVLVPSELSHEMENVLQKWSKEIEGVYLPKKFLTMKNEIANWNVDEEDVWICSFPKTGQLMFQKTYNRKFNKKFYDDENWLCGCEKRNAFFCFIYLVMNNPRSDPPWVTKAMCDIKHFTEHNENVTKNRHILGTTWTQEMVWLLMNNLDYKQAQKNLLKRSPHIEASCLVRYPHVKFFLPLIPTPVTASMKYLKNKKKKKQIPQCIKTHLPWNLLPMEIQKEIKRPKLIYVSRNPKDTCLSYYHFSKMVGDFNGSLEEFAQIFLAGKVNFAPFWNHVLPFWKIKDQSNVLFLKYEDMKRDLPNVIRQTAAFLEKSVTQTDIEILANHLSFKNMSKNSAVNYDWLVKLSNMYKFDRSNTFMRQGKVGGYKDQFSEQITYKFDQWIEENTKGTGLEYL